MLVTWTLVPVNGPVPTSTWSAVWRTYPGVFAFDMLPEMIDRFAWVALRPANAVESACERLMALLYRHAWFTPRHRRRGRSSLDHGQQALDHLVGNGHHLGVGRVGLLRHDQLTKLGGDVDVRPFERAARDLAAGRQ